MVEQKYFIKDRKGKNYGRTKMREGKGREDLR